MPPECRWALLPAVLPALFNDARTVFEEKVHPDSGKWNWRRFVFAMAWTEVPLGFLLAAALAASVSWGFSWRIGITFWLCSVFIGVIARMLIQCWTVSPQNETRYTNRVAVPFYITFLVAIISGYLIWFGISVYPHIPYSLVEEDR